MPLVLRYQKIRLGCYGPAMSTPPKRSRGRPRSERPQTPFMLRLDPETVDALKRIAGQESARGNGRALTAQDVARRASTSGTP